MFSLVGLQPSGIEIVSCPLFSLEISEILEHASVLHIKCVSLQSLTSVPSGNFFSFFENTGSLRPE